MSIKESYWFSHDCNARSDAKIVAMMQQYGMEGYGRWWILLERLRAEDDYKYAVDKKFAYNVLAQDMMCSLDDAKTFVEDCINEYELLETDGKHIWAPSLNARMKPLEEKRRIMSERGKKGAAATNAKRAAQAQQQDGTSETVPQQKATKKRKVKQNIEKKSRVEQSKEEHTTGQSKQATAEQSASSARAVIISLDGNEPSHPHQPCTERLKQQALADERRFVYPYVSSGQLTQEQLTSWLDAFNRHLAFIGDEAKTEKDYRTHFAAWLKYRDLNKEKPEDYNPIPEQKSKATVVPVAKFMKTPDMLEEERRQQKLRWMKKAKAGT